MTFSAKELLLNILKHMGHFAIIIVVSVKSEGVYYMNQYIKNELLEKFEFYNYGHALEILSEAFPTE